MNADTIPGLISARAVAGTATEDLYTLVDTQPIATVSGSQPISLVTIPGLAPRVGEGNWQPPLTYHELEHLLHRMRATWHM